MQPPATLTTIRPETFRLPKSGARDPYFSLSRSWYYAAEAEGLIKLIRLKKRGNIRGVVLVPFSVIENFVREESALRPD